MEEPNSDARGYRGVLAIPAFRRLWLAQLTAALGEAFASIALPLLAYAVTGSATLASQVFVAQLLPRIVLAPVSGLLADRLDRRRLMLAADLGRAVVVAVIPFAEEAWQIALLATLVAIGSALARPAELAAVPQVVPADRLVLALSASQVGNSVIRVAGPALGAVVIGLSGPRPIFWLQTVCFLFSSVVLLGVRLPPLAGNQAVPGAAAAWRDVRAGLNAVVRLPMVRGTALVEALWQAITAVLVIALVVFVERALGYGADAGPVYALLMATFSGGTTVGALAAGWVERRIGRARLMGIGYLAPLLLVPAAFVPPTPVLFALWFALGFTDAWAVIGMQAYLAEAVGNELRGRVYAIWTAAVTIGAAVAFLVVGWLTATIGPAPTIGAAGLVVGVGGPLLLLLSGAVAEMRRRGRFPASRAFERHPA